MGKKILIEYVRGTEGDSLYLNGLRVAGPKPWGSGKTVASWEVGIEQIKEALPDTPTEDSGEGKE